MIDTIVTYQRTVTCDTCGKKVQTSGESIQMTQMVPTDWVQVSPPGEKDMREFCSIKCFTSYKGAPSPNKPWAVLPQEKTAEDEEGTA